MPKMKLSPVCESNSVLAAAWLAEDQNRQWLDFRVATLTPLALQVMSHTPSQYIRLFCPDEGDEPIGIVAFSEIHRRFRTAQLWYVLGNKEYSGRGYTSRAVSVMLRLGFEELNLRCVNAWTVETNTRSISVLKTNGFRQAGKLRSAHEISGRVYDRLLFDLLASEFGGHDERFAKH